jgi:hypothetical protein
MTLILLLLNTYVDTEVSDQTNTYNDLGLFAQAYCCPAADPCECKALWSYTFSGQTIESSGCANPDNDIQTWCHVTDSCPEDMTLDFQGASIYCNAYDYPSSSNQHAGFKGQLGVAIQLANFFYGEPCCSQEIAAELGKTFINEEGTSVAPFSSRGVIP